MTSKILMLFLITLLFFSSTSSVFPQTNTSASVYLQDKKGKDDVMALYNNSRYGGSNGIGRRSIISSGRAGGGGSGSRSGSGNGGSGSGSRPGSETGGGGSTSPRTPGGAAVIPVYGAAGAANNNKAHHSSGNSYQGSTGLITALSATILLLLFTVYLD